MTAIVTAGFVHAPITQVSRAILFDSFCSFLAAPLDKDHNQDPNHNENDGKEDNDDNHSNWYWLRVTVCSCQWTGTH